AQRAVRKGGSSDVRPPMAPNRARVHRAESAKRILRCPADDMGATFRERAAAASVLVQDAAVSGRSCRSPPGSSGAEPEILCYRRTARQIRSGKSLIQAGLAEGTCVPRDHDSTRPAAEISGMTSRPATGREDWGADTGSVIRIGRRAAGLTQREIGGLEQVGPGTDRGL